MTGFLDYGRGVVRQKDGGVKHSYAISTISNMHSYAISYVHGMTGFSPVGFSTDTHVHAKGFTG